MLQLRQLNQGQGVFLVVKNYSGDVMNFDMAKDLASMDDIPVKEIVVDDDIAVENSTYTQGIVVLQERSSCIKF